MAIRFRRRPESQNEILGTYSFPSRTVQVLRTGDDRILWTCDCDKFLRQGGQREPLWCKHIAKAAARRSLERLTRRVAGARALSTETPAAAAPLPAGAHLPALTERLHR
jgi:hypothetical protein